MVFGIEVKALLMEKAGARIREYEKEERISARYKAPLIGYAQADNILFHELYSRGLCMHPKQIYRPGNTVIVYFVPFADEIKESNRGGNVISAAWDRAMGESVMLCAHINGTLRETIDELGHDTSGTNLPGDWSAKIFGPLWSHKYAALIAGIGNFGTAGSFHTAEGFAGCFGSVITTLTVQESKEWTEAELKNAGKILDDAVCAICSAPPWKSALCPVGAITVNGIDRFVCQEFCKKQDQPAPLPDVCGKCFF